MAIVGFGLPLQLRAQADDIDFSGATVSTNATEVMLIQKSTGKSKPWSWAATSTTERGKVTCHQFKPNIEAGF